MYDFTSDISYKPAVFLSAFIFFSSRWTTQEVTIFSTKEISGSPTYTEASDSALSFKFFVLNNSRRPSSSSRQVDRRSKPATDDVVAVVANVVRCSVDDDANIPVRMSSCDRIVASRWSTHLAPEYPVDAPSHLLT